MSFFTRASAAIDRGVLRLMERQMAPRTPKIDPSDARIRLVDLAAAYSAGLGHPSTFFPDPEVPTVSLRPAGDGPLGTQVVDLTWSSGYVPFLGPARELERVSENDVAHARWWTSGTPSDHVGARTRRPTIVAIHGWGGGNYWVEARAFVVPYWLRHGFDVVAAVLPYHGPRAPEITRSPVRSGALFPSPNPLRTNEGFGQAIWDLRSLARWLRARGASAVGAMGMSLGGYTTALWASVAGPDEVGGVDFAVAMIPAVSMSRLMWRHGEANPTRKRAAKAGITEDLLAETFAVHAPLSRAVRLPSERLAVIAGRGDRITPPDQAEALAAHWGVPISWFEGGHLAQVGRSDALRTVRRQLGGLGFAGREFRT